MVLPHYPEKLMLKKKKTKIKITLKKTRFFVIEGDIYINNYSKLHLPCRKASRPKHSN